MLLEVVRGGTPREVGEAAGRRLARQHGTKAGAVEVLEAVARRLGFEPRLEPRTDGTDVVLQRCPFVDAAGPAPDIVCKLHEGIAEGIAQSAKGRAHVIELVVHPPRRAGCRIRVATA